MREMYVCRINPALYSVMKLHDQLHDQLHCITRAVLQNQIMSYDKCHLARG